MSKSAGPDEGDPDEKEDESAALMHGVGHLGITITAERIIPAQEGEDGKQLRFKFCALVLNEWDKQGKGWDVMRQVGERRGVFGHTHHMPHQLHKHVT